MRRAAYSGVAAAAETRDNAKAACLLRVVNVDQCTGARGSLHSVSAPIKTRVQFAVGRPRRECAQGFLSRRGGGASSFDARNLFILF